MSYIYRFVLLFAINLTFLALSGCKEEKKEIRNFKVDQADKHVSVEIRKGQNKLINPLLDCYDFEATTNRDIKDLELNLNKIVAESSKNKTSTEISIYFRDLNNGPWMGINEDAIYSPASLLKVPMLIAALKQAEDEPEFLNKIVNYVDPIPQNMRYNQNIINRENQLELGKDYSIERLVEEMIIKSDNISKDVIFKHVWPSNYTEVYYDLGIDINKYNDSENYLTVKDYASFFRILYNATYLNKKMSEKALRLLTKTEFNNGIVAGVPKGVMVAHKFGERSYLNKREKQLHDCGIIYRPGKPYLLCVMVKGDDYKEMSELIQTISKTIYIHLDNVEKN